MRLKPRQTTGCLLILNSKGSKPLYQQHLTCLKQLHLKVFWLFWILFTNSTLTHTLSFSFFFSIRFSAWSFMKALFCKRLRRASNWLFFESIATRRKKAKQLPTNLYDTWTTKNVFDSKYILINQVSASTLETGKDAHCGIGHIFNSFFGFNFFFF